MEIKQVTVTFNFSPETLVCDNIHTFIDGVEVKKKTTRKASSKKEEIEDEPLIVREANRLVFNNNCHQLMNLSNEDRIIIKYEVNGKSKFPIIGTDTAFDEEGSGNKVTKNKTVSYRGKVNTILSEYGETFTVEKYKEDIWKLVSKDEKEKQDNVKEVETYEEAKEVAENLEVDLLTEDDTTTEIDELTFKL